jgi:molecular chaperone HscA
MLEEAIDHAETDMDERLLIDARVEAEQIIHLTRTAVAKDADLLDGDEAARFIAAITELEAAMSSRDRRLISGLGKRVDELTAPFAQRRIERDIKLALEGHSADEVSAQLGA